MYVIEDKKGRFWKRGAGFGKGTRSLDKATKFDTRREMIVIKANGERVFEVHLTLGKQVR